MEISGRAETDLCNHFVVHLRFPAVWCQATYSKAFSEKCCPLRQNVVTTFFNGSLMLVESPFPTVLSTGIVDSGVYSCGLWQAGEIGFIRSVARPGGGDV